MNRGPKRIPLQLHEATGGRSRMTNAEKAERSEQEASLQIGDHQFKAPPEVRADKDALGKWNWIINLYKDNNFTFVTTADTDIIARYCITYSEYVRARAALVQIQDNPMYEGDSLMTMLLIEQADLNSIINKKNEILLKLGQRLYLDPVSRIASVSKKKEKEIDPLKKKGLDNV